MVSVSTDEQPGLAARLPRMADVGFPVLFDPEHRIAFAYHVEALPHNVVIDREGRVQAVILGADHSEINAAVRRVAGS